MGAPKLAERRGAPRYRFTAEDRKVVRFTSSRVKAILTSQILDMSETGIAFVVHRRICPRVGELIKMEFSGLNNVHIACVARVIRTEEPTLGAWWSRYPGVVKVGVTYHNLPGSYQRTLSRAITQLLKDHPGRSSQRAVGEISAGPGLLERAAHWILEKAGAIVTTVVTLIALSVAGYYFVNYARTRQPAQSSWAQGFFDRTLQPRQNGDRSWEHPSNDSSDNASSDEP